MGVLSQIAPSERPSLKFNGLDFKLILGRVHLLREHQRMIDPAILRQCESEECS